MAIKRLAFIVAAHMLLTSCLLTPGKFVSTLDIRKDRTFAFSYAGEVVVVEEKSDIAECGADDEDCDSAALAAEAAGKKTAQEAKLREIGEALGREAGYRSVEYLGDRKYRVDYAVNGKLDRNFIFPFNSDAAAIFPWVAVELRKDGTARLKAPGFGGENDVPGVGPGNPFDDSAKLREGTFTLTTDAEIVMQNEEGGPRPGPGGGKTIVWRITPASKTVPTAVLRFAP
jgi:hypothetical protein